jgi:hypothetical protein
MGLGQQRVKVRRLSAGRLDTGLRKDCGLDDFFMKDNLWKVMRKHVSLRSADPVKDSLLNVVLLGGGRWSVDLLPSDLAKEGLLEIGPMAVVRKIWTSHLDYFPSSNCGVVRVWG